MTGKRLDAKQIELLRKTLLDIKEKTLEDIRKMSSVGAAEGQEGVEDVAGHALHMADVATDMYDREFNLGLASNDRQILSQVEDALKRIEAGEYGQCTECRQPIPLARLKALPYVQTCLTCQEKLEEKS